MKLMTYNILNGGQERLESIIDIIRQQAPDYLSINEANIFAKNNNKILKEIAQKLKFPYFDIAKSEFEKHVAVYSKVPFAEVVIPVGYRNACISTVIQSDLGKLSITSTHLSAKTEANRLQETKILLKIAKKYHKSIILGDMNSLAIVDNYSDVAIKKIRLTKHPQLTVNGQVQYKVYSAFKGQEFFDSAFILKLNGINTVPTPVFDKLWLSAKLRVDYIFISKSLLPHLKSYAVIKNDLTEKASDHYPVVVELNAKNQYGN